MAEKNSFIVYADQLIELKEVHSFEQLGRLLYSLSKHEVGQDVAIDSDIAGTYTLMKIALDKNRAKYEKVCEVNAGNARKRWEKDNATACDRIKSQPLACDGNDNDTDNDIDTEYDNEFDNEFDNDTDSLYAEDGEPVRLSRLLYDRILMNDSQAKKPDFQKWALHIDRLIRLDNRSPADIEKVIIFCQDDDFWKSNILSTKKLREKYQSLYLKMNNQPKPKPTFNPAFENTRNKDYGT